AIKLKNWGLSVILRAAPLWGCKAFEQGLCGLCALRGLATGPLQQTPQANVLHPSNAPAAREHQYNARQGRIYGLRSHLHGISAKETVAP
ncbi:MAG: hypothetical protein FWC64_11350, partial [Treponema sp.]|nr:hypothetical protein [Treponema sp.]